MLTTHNEDGGSGGAQDSSGRGGSNGSGRARVAAMIRLPIIESGPEAAGKPSPGTIPFVPSGGTAPHQCQPQPQPEPIDYSVGYAHTGTVWVTAITREWEDAEVARCHCRWCPKSECDVSDGGVCTVLVIAHVDADLARTFARPGSLAAGTEPVPRS